MFRLIVPLLLASTIAANAQQQIDFSGSYFCKYTASGGLRYDSTNKRWVGAAFNVGDEATLISVDLSGEQRAGAAAYSVTVKDFGNSGDPSICSDAGGMKYTVIYFDGSTSCNTFGHRYEINFRQLKMQVVYRGGYMDNETSNTDTPYIAVAKCDKVS